ncbi:uncharacterized protein C9orf85 homolog [Bactrocera neohumeralis]|uniref:uncharacterized protein C9orf85 homolog n=1 Tax=Bactrocera neohumeralis TaxID=98809 RepID=UPI00216604E4|nr:uncharacterized protein C9orf85 homolog [Bactrocera neohumeralis]
MSTQRGNATRTRSQKHKNRTVFKNDLHDKTNLQKKINSLHVSEVCQHCKDVIEWKIKYKKYKPLTQPKKCTRCEQKNIIKAYHVLCRHCALETHVCAKCLKSEEQVVIEPPQPTMEEQVKLKVEMERLIKSLPERKRRAFIRYMDKGKKQEDLEETVSGEGIESDTKLRKQSDDKINLPHTREELIQKIEFLKLNNEDEYIISDADLESDNESPI